MNAYLYILLSLFTVVLLSIFGSYIRKYFSDTESADEHKMIREYLLNDSPLYGYNKPKLWIHNIYDINARSWESFGSPNTRNLNQPYLHLTIKSIVEHCGDDFHVCLIDDNTFAKILPNWDIDLDSTAEPLRSQLRTIGFLKIIYYYGGMFVPSSFICQRNLAPLYYEYADSKLAFCFEQVNRTVSQRVFIPNLTFFGACKNHASILDLLEFAKENAKQLSAYSNEFEFTGVMSNKLLALSANNDITICDGSLIGVKTATEGRPILLDDLIEESYLDLVTNYYGIYIPYDEVLRRTTCDWIAYLSKEELLASNLCIAKYLISALLPTSSNKGAINALQKKTNNLLIGSL